MRDRLVVKERERWVFAQVESVEVRVRRPGHLGGGGEVSSQRKRRKMRDTEYIAYYSNVNKSNMSPFLEAPTDDLRRRRS